MDSTEAETISVIQDRLGTLVKHLVSHATITGKVLSLDSNCPLCAQFGKRGVN